MHRLFPKGGKSTAINRKSIGLKWLYLMILTPTITEFLETGQLSVTFRGFTTEIVLSCVLFFAVWKILRLYKRVESLAFTDPMTGLFSRRLFQEDLVSEVYRAQRMGFPLVLAYIDADNFKAVNDTFGHQAGDEVIQSIGKLLLQTTRTQVDKCYRIGGDEFAVLMPVTDTAGALHCEQRITRLSDEPAVFLSQYNTGLSVGIVCLLEDETPEQFSWRADELMYRNKHSKIQRRLS